MLREWTWKMLLPLSLKAQINRWSLAQPEQSQLLLIFQYSITERKIFMFLNNVPMWHEWLSEICVIAVVVALCMDKMSTLISCKINKLLHFIISRTRYPHTHAEQTATKTMNRTRARTQIPVLPSSLTTHRKPIIQLSTCSCLRLFVSFVSLENKFSPLFLAPLCTHRRTLAHVCSNLTTTLNITLYLKEYGNCSHQHYARHSPMLELHMFQ